MILLQGPRLRRWVLGFVVAGVPLIFLRFTNDPFNVPKLAFLTAGVAVVLAIRIIELLQGASRAGLTRLLVPAAAIVLPLLVSWALSPYRYWSLFGYYGRFQGLVPYLLVITLGVLLADAFAEDLRHLAWALTIAGGVAGAYAVLQFAGLDPFTWTQQFGGEATRTSTLGNPNFTGGFLAMVLPIAVALWRSEDPNAKRALQASVLVAAGLVLSFSQGPYAAAVAGGIVFAGLLISGNVSWARLVALVCVIGMATLMLGAVGYAMTNANADIVPATTAQRALWWRGALSMVAEHPLVGRGPNTYAVDGNRYRPADDAAVHGLDYSDDTHSVPLSFATGAGALGVLGYLIVMGWIVYKARTVNGGHLLQVGFVAALAAYFIQSLVSIDEIALRTTFWAILGGLAASLAAPAVTNTDTRRKRTSPKAKSRKSATKTIRRTPSEPPRRLPVVAVVVLVALFAVWWSGAFVLSDARVRWATASFRAGEPEEGRADFERAIEFRGDYRYRHLNGFFAGQAALTREERGSEWLREARDAFGFLETTPIVPALVDYARILLEYSEFDPSLRQEAADAYLRVTRYDPYNAALLAEAASALLEARQPEALVELLEDRLTELEDRSPILWAYLAAAYERTGEDAAAEEALERAVAAGVSDPIVDEVREGLGDA